MPPWLAAEAPEAPVPAAPAPAEEGLPPWLAAEAPEAPVPAAPAPAEEGLPPWLAAEVPEAPVPAAPTPTEEVIPEWLPSSLPSAPAPVEESLPPWLAVEAPAAGPAAPPPSEVPSWLGGLEENLPSWLSAEAPVAPKEEAEGLLAGWLVEQAPPGELPTEAVVPPVEAAPPGAPALAPTADVEEEVLPPWLAAEAVEAPVSEAPAPAEEGLPPWLAAEAVEAPVPEAPAPAEEGLPPWLAAEAVEAPVPEAPAPAEEIPPPWMAAEAVPEPPPEEAPMPWMEGATPAAVEPAAEEVEPAPVVPEEAEPLPGWAAAPPPVVEAPRPPQEPAEPLVSEKPAPEPFLEGLELPEWLRVEEKEAPAQPAEAPSSDMAWLQQLVTEEVPEEPLPMAALESLPRPALPPLSAARQRAVDLLNGLLAAPEPIVAPRPARAITFPQRLLRWLGQRWPMLAMAALMVALVVGNLPIPAMTVPISSRTMQAVEVIEQSAGAGDAVVLVAYDWDVQRAAEMQPLALAVTSHLVKREARIIAVSTLAQGGQLAQDVLAAALATPTVLKPNQQYDYGEHYVNLGLRTGGESALRMLVARPLYETFPRDFLHGRPSANYKLLQQAGTLDRVALLVVIAGEEDRAIAWLEQVRSRYPDLPCLLVVPAELVPLVEPYVQARSIAPDGVLEGFPAAAEYEAWLRINEGIALNTDFPLAQRRTLLTAAEIALVALVVLGNLAQAAAGLIRLRRDSRGS